MKPETAKFLEIINRQAEGVAAREAAKRPEPESDVDPIREQRDQERREKFGELRAREHPGKRGRQVRSAFGHIDLT